MNLKFDIKNDRQLQIALGATLFLLAVILSIFLDNGDYFEAGQEYYFSAIVLGLGLLFWSLWKMNIISLIGAALIIVVAMSMSILKFDWRKSYIEQAERGDPFIFEEYIDGYPTLEEYMMASFFGGPNWIAFARSCGEPVLENRPVAPVCSDLQAIEQEFGLDMQVIVNNYYKKMKRTANRIAKGQLTDKRRFETCLRNRQCVMVPLLPPDIDPENVKTNEYNDIRTAFWSLVEDKKLNLDVCQHMELCSILIQTGALKESSF